MQIPFIGGMAEDRSLALNAQKSINCFPVIDNKEGKNTVAMYGTPGLKFFAAALAYGDGTDGNVTISVNTSLTRDMKYTTLTVNNGIVLNTAGFIVCCSTSLTNNGTITDSSSGGAGGVGGSNFDIGIYGRVSLVPGSGSGGLGGDGGNTGDVGATGGKGGGLVRVYAKTLTNNGVIHADGFDGISDAVGTGSGADGGNGGTVMLVYDSRTTGTVRANGGAHSNQA